MRLKKHDVRQAMSWPVPIDIVFYKHEKNIVSVLKQYVIEAFGREHKESLYRLRLIHDNTTSRGAEGLHHVMCLGKYAPEIIDGEIIFDSENEMRIKDKKNSVYVIQKNAEEVKFWDVTDECKGIISTEPLRD